MVVYSFYLDGFAEDLWKNILVFKDNWEKVVSRVKTLWLELEGVWFKLQ